MATRPLPCRAMNALLETIRPLLDIPYVRPTVGLILLFGAAWLLNAVTRVVLRRVIARLFKATENDWDDALLNNDVVRRLVLIAPALVVQYGVLAVPGLHPNLVLIIRNVAACMVVVAIAATISNALNAVNDIYMRSAKRAKERPIKGFLQVVQLVVWVAAGLLVIATLINKSPLILLSGLGAMTAVTMLVFQDTILSLVASVQISSQDMLRVGDWIEMPSQNTDGDVIDIALNVVKVQNFDKTVSTIPTHRFISQSFKNWRGMQESGGRRIKRALLLDQTSVRFLTDNERDDLRRIALIDDYLDQKRAELEDYNAKLLAAGKDPVNTRRVTNLGTFRAYVAAYLRANPRIHPTLFQLVRQLEPTSNGIPLEIYCFTNTVSWGPYEEIQADLFDHLLAMLPVFGLRLHQHPTGQDFKLALAQLAPGTGAESAAALGGAGRNTLSSGSERPL